MANTVNTGAILQTLPINDIVVKNEVSVANKFINKLKFIPFDSKSKIFPIALFNWDSGNPSVPVLEGESPTEQTIQFKGKKIQPKHFLEKIVLSNEYADNTDEENIKIALNMALGRIMRGITEQIVDFGFADSEDTIVSEESKLKMARLFSAANGNGTSKTGEPLKYKDVSEVYAEMNDLGKTEDAFWIINTSALFSVVDTFGNEKLSFTDVPKGASATLLGKPVYLANYLNDKDGKNIAFALVHPDAYGITISDVNVIQPELDTYQAINNSKVYGVEVWADGRVLDDHSKRARYFAPTTVQQASVTEQSIDEPKPVKRKATKVKTEKE